MFKWDILVSQNIKSGYVLLLALVFYPQNYESTAHSAVGSILISSGTAGPRPRQATRGLQRISARGTGAAWRKDWVWVTVLLSFFQYISITGLMIIGI